MSTGQGLGDRETGATPSSAEPSPVFSPTHLRAMLLAIGQPALVVDAELRIVAANPPALRLLDMLDMEPVGQPLSFALRAPAILKAALEALTRGGVVMAEHHLRVPVPKSLSVQFSSLGQDELGAKLVLGLMADLTYQEQVERMRADFVANASHELRTPLTSLMGFIETMQMAARDDKASREQFLVMMRAQAERMARLIDDLLSLSRIEMNEHVQPSAIIDLAVLARQAGALLGPVAEKEDVVLRFNLPSSLTARGDSSEISQVLFNLIENAIKYASSGKFIDIVGELQEGEAIITVCDHGPGIAAHHVPRLTERFYRVSAKDSRTRGGTGLGLAIVKHILNRHRGRLAIESATGRGSRFSMVLPSAK